MKIKNLKTNSNRKDSSFHSEEYQSVNLPIINDMLLIKGSEIDDGINQSGNIASLSLKFRGPGQNS